MKIQILDQNTKKPFANGKLQLQVRGKDSGYLTTTTDANGFCIVDDKLKGQQISIANTSGQNEKSAQGQWIQANEDVKLYITATTANVSDKTTTKY